MPRKPVRHRKRAQQVPGCIIKYFETGDFGLCADMEGFCDFYFFNDDAEHERIWYSVKAKIMPGYIREHPGRRPYAWWKYEAPTMRPEDVPARWKGTSFDGTMIEPRRQVGGIGDPAHLHLNYAPWFKFGVPVSWLSQRETDYYSGRAIDIHGNPVGPEHKGRVFPGVGADPDDPPLIESQATYLKRHGLLTKSELNQLDSADFEPESIKIDA